MFLDEEPIADAGSDAGVEETPAAEAPLDAEAPVDAPADEAGADDEAVA